MYHTKKAGTIIRICSRQKTSKLLGHYLIGLQQVCVARARCGGHLPNDHGEQLWGRGAVCLPARDEGGELVSHELRTANLAQLVPLRTARGHRRAIGLCSSECTHSTTSSGGCVSCVAHTPKA